MSASTKRIASALPSQCRAASVDTRTRTRGAGIASQQQGRRRAFTCGALLAVLLAAANAWATPLEPEMTPEQAATVHRVAERLMSPCCFGGTIATHHSPIADEIRGEVQSMVMQGATESQILDHFLEIYGERILAQPVPRGFNLLAYWMPGIAFLCGTGLVTLWLLRRRSAGGGGAEDSVSDRSGGTEATPERLRNQFEKELAAYDA